MSSKSPDLSITADTVPGRRGALTASPSQAVPTTNSPTGGTLPLSATERTRHRRFRHLGRVDRDSLYAVLDAGLVAHLGVITGGWPMVVPTVYGFTADTLYLHGSVASQSLNTAGAPVCVTITLTDGLVLARSVFEHTINYRSAMIYGQPRLVTDPAERLAGLRCITEHVAPCQWDYARQPSRKELAAVRLLALSLDEASVKIRTGPPDDGDSPDAALGLWAGELPLATTWQQPIPDPALPPGIPVPAHVSSRAGTRADRSTSSKPGSRTDKRSAG
jgi:nitroimidazol reductase NimA-like FMN-containing flavoprotein (pyridoxamine 5'-phosphate oxidase superfamily)